MYLVPELTFIGRFSIFSFMCQKVLNNLATLHEVKYTVANVIQFESRYSMLSVHRRALNTYCSSGNSRRELSTLVLFQYHRGLVTYTGTVSSAQSIQTAVLMDYT